MPNMNYCRFENTLGDLQECYDSIDEPDLSETEEKAREALIELCCDIAHESGRLK